MGCLADRIKEVLRTSHVNVRSLSAVAELHYTTVYVILRKGDKANPHHMVQKALEAALDTIDKLVADKHLPLPEGLAQESKDRELKSLFNKH